MRKEPLSDIRKRVEAVFIERGYKAVCLRRYNNTWDHLKEYMLRNGHDLYTDEVGRAFLEEKYGNIQFSEMKDRQRECVRHIDVLSDMLENGVVNRTRLYRRDISFDGTDGHWFNMYLYTGSEHKAAKTIRLYRDSLFFLYDFLRQREESLYTITPKLLSEYITYLEELQTVYYRNRIIMITRTFFRYLCAHKVLRDNREGVWIALMKIKNLNGNRLPSVYTEEEIEHLINVIDRTSAQGKRDYAMILLAARYGLRISDIVGLRFTNIDWERDRLVIMQQKTGALSTFPLTEEVGGALIDYIKNARPNIDSPCVFITARAPYKPVQDNPLGHKITEYMRMAGIDASKRRAGPHALRHSLATNLLRKNVTLPVISEILGHSSTDSTKIYLRVNVDMLRQCALDVPFVPSSFYANLYD